MVTRIAALFSMAIVLALAANTHAASGDRNQVSIVNLKTQQDKSDSRVISPKSQIRDIEDIVDICSQAKMNCGLELDEDFFKTPVVLSTTQLTINDFFSELASKRARYSCSIRHTTNGVTLDLRLRSRDRKSVLNKVVRANMASQQALDGYLKMISKLGGLYYSAAPQEPGVIEWLGPSPTHNPIYEQHALRYLLDYFTEGDEGTWAVTYTHGAGTLKWFPRPAGR